MTDIVDVLTLKLTTARSHVERHVLTRARDEIVTLRSQLNNVNQPDVPTLDIEQYQLPWTS